MLDELLKIKEELEKKLDENNANCERIGSEGYAIFEQLDELRLKGGDLLHENELRVQLEQVQKRDHILWEESLDLRKQYKEVKRRIYFLSSPVGNNEIVDLRTTDERQYEIFLHGESTLIGSVDYRGYHTSDYLGDVGGYIKEEFRGHHYLYEALCVLGEILGEKGIDDFWVSTYRDNVASRKSIERYGGTLIDDGNRYNGVLLYECLTRKKELGAKNSR